jgi:hypothetical protein
VTTTWFALSPCWWMKTMSSTSNHHSYSSLSHPKLAFFANE